MIIHNQPFAEYVESVGLSASTLKRYALMTPAEARYAELNPKPATDQMALGTIAHVAVLEPDRFARAYIQAEKCDRRTTVGKTRWAELEAQAAATGAELIQPEVYDLAQRMAESVRANPACRDLLKHGHAEVSMYGEVGGIPVKSREDWMVEGEPIIVELKTARAADIRRFSTDAYRLGYHIGAHHYRLTRQAAVGGAWPDYIWIVVCTDAPHLTALYRPSPRLVEIGELDWLRAIKTRDRCKVSGEYPGLPEYVQELDPPRWADHAEDEP